MRKSRLRGDERIYTNAAEIDSISGAEDRGRSYSRPTGVGEPLRDYETVVRLIAGTTTAKGLKVTCRLDHREYAVGRKTKQLIVNVTYLQRLSIRDVLVHVSRQC